MKRARTRRAALMTWSCVAMMLVVSGPAPVAGGGKPKCGGILPPGGVAYGKTYGDWNAEFWKWALSMPTTAHPLYDTAPVSAGQTGPVWFLGGSFESTITPEGVVAIAERDVVIPRNKAIFIGVANAEASNLEGNGTTFAELNEAANFFASFFDVNTLSLEIDGEVVEDLGSYYASSDLYRFKLAKTNNVLSAIGAPGDLDGARGISVAAGYGVLLAPLDPGTHEIHFHAEVPDFGFLIDITYHITVPRK